jgi:acyl dehydratase
VCIYDGGWGGEAPPKDIVEMPEREADAVVAEMMPLNMPLIYRLMGDWHQQHIDWDYAEQTGLDRPIAHAISYAGIVMRHAIATYFPGEPERMTRFKTRVTSPLIPGTHLVTKMWKVGDKEIRFQLADADADETGAKPHLNWGIIEWD